MFRFTTIASVALVMGFILGVCACDVLINVFNTPDDEIDILYEPIPMDIGLVVPLTGEYAAPYGFSMQRGFELAREEINNSPLSPIRINFIAEDDTSTADGMVSAFQRLVNANVPAIVGIVISTHAEQAFPIAQDNQVVAFSSVSSAAGLSSIGDYIFRTPLATDRMNPAGVKATHAQLGYERVAMIYDDADVYSTSSNEHLTAALEELGVEVATTQTFQTGDTDFAAQLAVIMESTPEAVFVAGLAAEVVQIMTQGRDIGIEAQYIVPEISMHEVQLAGEAAEGTITFVSWSGTSDNPLNHAFVERYREAYGIEPDPWAAQSYATLLILFAGIVTALSTDTVAPDAMAIRDALATVENMDTNLGSLSFDPNGEALYEPVVLMVKDGVLEIFGSGGI